MKKEKRLLAALMAALLLLCGVPFAAAEEDTSAQAGTETIEYVGGVIEHGWLGNARTRAATLDVAYILCSDSMLRVGKETTWTIVAEGGAAPYTYDYMLWWQAFSNTTNTYSSVWNARRTDAQTTYAPTKEGRYFIDLTVTDANGEYIKFQSQIYQTTTEADALDEDTVAGKVNAIVESVVTDGMGEYAKALALHDWLTHNADYDTTYTNYTPEGVLLEGSGVCQSYALAYQLLLQKAGISCLYVTGTAGGQGHAWNLVKLGGDWYHVDCTWDDPVGGGQESRAYFALPDSMMARDHTWNTEGETRVPVCTATRYTYILRNTDVVYGSIDELDALAAALPSGLREISFYYTGTEDVSDAFKAWLQAKLNSFGFGADVTGARVASSGYSTIVTLTRSGAAVVVSPRSLCMEKGETTTLTVNVYPEDSAVTWTSSNESVVTVSKAGVVTARALGTATVTCTMDGGSLSASCAIEVIEAAETTTPIVFFIDSDGVMTGYAGSDVRVRVPSDVKTLGDGAFAGNTSVVGVILPDGVTAIQAGALDGCTRLTAIAMGANVSIEDGAIPASVETVYAPLGGSAYAWALANGKNAVASDKTQVNRYVLPVALREIGEEAFVRCGADAVTIAAGCERIGARAFDDCAALMDATIPNSVTAIAADAFADCLLLAIHASEGSAAHEYALAQGFDWSAE